MRKEHLWKQLFPKAVTLLGKEIPFNEEDKNDDEEILVTPLGTTTKSTETEEKTLPLISVVPLGRVIDYSDLQFKSDWLLRNIFLPISTDFNLAELTTFPISPLYPNML